MKKRLSVLLIIILTFSLTFGILPAFAEADKNPRPPDIDSSDMNLVEGGLSEACTYFPIPLYGSLLIMKSIDSCGGTYEVSQSVQLFTIHITFSNTSAGLDSILPLSSAPDINITGSSGDYEVTLKAGQWVSFIGVPAGTEYSVSEPVIPLNWVLSDIIYSNPKKCITAWVLDMVNVVNKYTDPPGTGSLKVNMMIDEDSDAYDLSQAFLLRVAFTGAAEHISGISYAGSDPDVAITGSEGIYDITLKGGQSAEFTNIPAGAAYMVSEPSLPSGWTLSGIEYGNQEKTISADGTDIATVKIKYKIPDNPEYGSIVIQKEIDEDSDTYDLSQDFSVRVTFTGASENISGIVYEGSDPDVAITGSEGVYDITLKGGQSARFTNIPAGAAYTVTEPTLPSGWTLGGIEYGNQEKTISADITETVSVINRYKTPINPEYGSLVIQKTIDEDSDGYDLSQDFSVRVTFTGASENISGITYAGSDPDVAITGSEGVYDITLKGGQSARFTNIPAGAAYIVTEPSLPSGWTLSGIDYSDSEKTISAETTDTVTVSNRYTAPYDPQHGTLTVTKLVTGTGADISKEFAIEVSFYGEGSGIIAPPDAEVKQSPDPYTYIYSIYLHHNESAVFSHIPYGFTYTVIEKEPLTSPWSYVSGNVTANSEASFDSENANKYVSIINRFDSPSPPPPPPPQQPQLSQPLPSSSEPLPSPQPAQVLPAEGKYGTLTVEKSISGAGSYSEETFEIIVTFIKGEHEIDGITNTEALTGTDNTYRLLLANGQSVTFSNIPAGTKYSVTEKLTKAQLEAGWAQPESISGTISAGEALATVTNVYISMKLLPQTGGISVSTLLGIVGIALIITGGIIYLIAKRKRRG